MPSSFRSEGLDLHQGTASHTGIERHSSMRTPQPIVLEPSGWTPSFRSPRLPLPPRFKMPRPRTLHDQASLATKEVRASPEVGSSSHGRLRTEEPFTNALV